MNDPEDNWRPSRRLTQLAWLAVPVAVIFAAIAAIASLQAVRESSKASRAGVALEFMSRYTSPEMRGAILTLDQWERVNRGAAATAYYRHLADRDESVRSATTLEGIADRDTAGPGSGIDSLDNARRFVWGYFLELQNAVEEGTLDHNFIHRQFGRGTFSFIQRTLMPLQQARIRYTHDSGRSSDLAEEESNQRVHECISFYDRALN